MLRLYDACPQRNPGPTVRLLSSGGSLGRSHIGMSALRRTAPQPGAQVVHEHEEKPLGRAVLR